MTELAGTDIVIADRHADGIFTLFVGLDKLTILGARHTIHGKLHTLYRDCSTLIIYDTADRE